jgi:hypothetical protein
LSVQVVQFRVRRRAPQGARSSPRDQTLLQRWQQTSAELTRPDLPLGAVAAGFLNAGRANRTWSRLMAWQGLAVEGADQPGSEEQSVFLRAMVVDLERRQRAGELAADLDPACVMLALFAGASAPTVLPHIVRAICGLDPDSDEFIEPHGRAAHPHRAPPPGTLTRSPERPGPPAPQRQYQYQIPLRRLSSASC